MFLMASKSIKYLGGDLTNEVKYLYTKNYKTPMEEIKDNTNKWKIIPCPWTERPTIIKI